MVANKKGMELPITAIIVLIISITFLGLVLYFIKTSFGGAIEQVGDQLSLLDEQTKTAMERTGEIVSFNFGETLELKKGTRKDIKVGIKNSYSNSDPNKKNVCHRFVVKCIQAFDPTNMCPVPAIVGGMDDLGETAQGTNAWFIRLLGETDLPNNEFVALPATVQIATAKPDTYIMEAELFVSDMGGEKSDCSNKGTFLSTATKRFTIEMS